MLSKMNTFKLYRALFKWIRKKYKRAYIDVYYNDVKCENCNVWYSISSIDNENELIRQPEWGQVIKCGQCGHLCHWNCVAAPFPVRADFNGTPIVDK